MDKGVRSHIWLTNEAGSFLILPSILYAVSTLACTYKAGIRDNRKPYMYGRKGCHKPRRANFTYVL